MPRFALYTDADDTAALARVPAQEAIFGKLKKNRKSKSPRVRPPLKNLGNTSQRSPAKKLLRQNAATAEPGDTNGSQSSNQKVDSKGTKKIERKQSLVQLFRQNAINAVKAIVRAVSLGSSGRRGNSSPSEQAQSNVASENQAHSLPNSAQHPVAPQAGDDHEGFRVPALNPNISITSSQSTLPCSPASHWSSQSTQPCSQDSLRSCESWTSSASLCSQTSNSSTSSLLNGCSTCVGCQRGLANQKAHSCLTKRRRRNSRKKKSE